MIANYNKEIGEAFQVSKDGVLTVDLQNKNYRKEFLKQLKLIRTNTDKKKGGQL